ncbi:leucine-rich colipase-like protein 1 [Saccopteryx bilineata]|uniref:leucine-rich colipase-like protein 1 n=1 Tax=Saccopteryx bilineata TaxID=59482 RepID=UPI00338E6694
MAHAGHWLLLFCVLLQSMVVKEEVLLAPRKGTGKACEDHWECQSHCCVTSSIKLQQTCRPRTLFMECVFWRKPNGYKCSNHLECRSRCCVTNSKSPLTFCTPKMMMFQCLPWGKPNWDYCSGHSECQSQCCIRLTKVTAPRCVARSGFLAQCLPPDPVSLSLGSSHLRAFALAVVSADAPLECTTSPSEIVIKSHFLNGTSLIT